MTIKKNDVQADYDIRPPSEEALKEIVLDLKLTEQQALALNRAIEHAFSQINLHQGRNHSPEKRKDLIIRMRNLEKALTKLEYEIARSQKYMNDYLPFDALEMIGTRSSLAFIREVLGDNAISPSLEFQMNIEFAEKGFFGDYKIDSISRPILQAIGLKHGSELFERYISDLLGSLKTWRRLNGAGSARRPALIYRQHLIRILIISAQEILGKPAAKSPNGKFVVLCERVVEACGLQGSTIGPSIPKLVEELYPTAKNAGIKEK